MSIDNSNLFANTVCAFTGHRPEKLPSDIRELRVTLTATIEAMIIRKGACHFISGMALGVDMLAAEIVIELKKKYPYITLEAAIPCNGQHNSWPEAEKKRYLDILSKADKANLLNGNYTRGCMMMRNKYMVDKAQILISVWDFSSGGTANTVKYALTQQKKGKNIDIIRIDPTSLKVERLPNQELFRQLSIFS